MKTLTCILLLSISGCLAVSGCTQVDLTPDRLKINTFLMTSGLESLTYDPNGVFSVGKYQGIPSEITLKYNPLTNTYQMTTVTKRR